MELHARQIAISAGATGDQVEPIARRMVSEDEITIEKARSLLEEQDTL
jgi:hydroxymethylglutaryl-CoA reductase